MLTFKAHLRLNEEKNTHMEHVEDLVFNEGVAGVRKAVKFLGDLRDMLAGHNKKAVTATVKWDGAPAVFAGIDPRDGKFFVAKKGVFNKEPKVYKTPAEVDADTDGDLAVKLKVALEEFKKLGIKSGVYQGDLMFTHDTLKKEKIDGQDYITFHPNTIVYAIKADTPEAKQILAAKIGVVWHTTYSGDSFETMKATFGKSIVSKLTKVPSVWMDDANYKDYSGTASFTKAETMKFDAILSKVEQLAASVKPAVLNGISNNADLLIHVKAFNNSKIRGGEQIADTTKHVNDMVKEIHAKLEPKQKTEKGKAAGEAKRQAVLSYFDKINKADIAKVFDLVNALVMAKHMVVNKMNQAGNISTFLRTANGFKTTGVEGFVAIDHLTGGAVKIINRMEFSNANFSPDIIKGWQR